MIVVDASQVFFAAVANEIKRSKMTLVDEGFLRHLILNHLRSFNVKFRDRYGTMVLVFDSRSYWRKTYFAEYKAHRKKHRDDSMLDWKQIFETVGVIKDEIIASSVFPTIVVEDAEADDTIAIMAHQAVQVYNEKVLIISSDHDYQQLQYLGKMVHQYSPIKHEMVVCKDIRAFITDHVLNGDKGDGVPNVLSPGNSFVKKLKQKSMLKGRWNDLVAAIDVYNDDDCGYMMRFREDSTLDTEVRMRILKNWSLVVLANKNHIPGQSGGQTIKMRVLDKYEALHSSFVFPTGTQLFGFLSGKGLKRLAQSLEDFMVSKDWNGKTPVREKVERAARVLAPGSKETIDFLNSLVSGSTEAGSLESFLS